MEVSIIIVNYKTPELLEACVKSVIEHTKGCTFEIIVVDNQSEDVSKDLITTNYPTVRWIDMGYNAGFGRANNRGIAEAKGDFTLLLNSDVELYEDAISKTLIHYRDLERLGEKVGLLGCRIMHEDGRLQPSCNYYWAGLREAIEEHPVGIKILQHWLKVKKLRSIDKYTRLDTNHEVVWLGVPFALIRTSLMQQFQFDPQFFMYSEDEELNYRLSEAGYKPHFFAETGVYHHIGASSKNNKVRDKQILFSKWLFILKTRGRFYLRIYFLIQKSRLRLEKKFGASSTELDQLRGAYNFVLKLSKSDNEMLDLYHS